MESWFSRRLAEIRKAVGKPEDYAAYAERPLAFLEERLGFFPDVHQAKIFDTRVKRGLLLCTRQFGKSTTLAAVAVHRACVEPGSVIIVVIPTECPWACGPSKEMKIGF